MIDNTSLAVRRQQTLYKHLPVRHWPTDLAWTKADCEELRLEGEVKGLCLFTYGFPFPLPLPEQESC